MNPQNYSAKGGPFFDRNLGIPRTPTNPGPGGEQFYGDDASLSAGADQRIEDSTESSEGFSVSDGITQGGNAGPVGKSGGISADGDMVDWKPTDPFTSRNPGKKTN